MAMPSEPKSSFVMIEAEFFLELLVAVLNPVPFMIDPRQVKPSVGIACGMLLKKYRNSTSPLARCRRSTRSQTSS